MGKFIHEAKGFVLSHTALEVAGAVLWQNPRKHKAQTAGKKEQNCWSSQFTRPLFVGLAGFSLGGLTP